MTASPRKVSIAVVQCALGGSRAGNVGRVEALVREAARRGASVVVTPELFEGPYFPREEDDAFFSWARPLEGNETVARFAAVARDVGVVLPVSFFERAGPAFFNSVVVIDADGSTAGFYRKSHVPDGPGYEEKYYFRPGDTGLRAHRTRAGTVGVGICWDQWFPEAARAMVLGGAEVLLYPTAIGSEPGDPGAGTSGPWRRAMVGHAVCNVVPVAASNRVGREGGQTFYGSSFVADAHGEVVAELGRDEEGVALASFDLDEIARTRAAWGFFRDRRPDLYGPLAGAGSEGASPPTLPLVATPGGVEPPASLAKNRFRPEVAAALAAYTERGPYPVLLGLRVDRAEPGLVVCSLPIDDRLQSGAGAVHGGAISSLVDHTLSMVVYPLVEPGKWVATAEFKLNFVGWVKDGVLVATGKLLTLGARMGVVRVDVENGGRLVAAAQGTVYVRDKPGGG